MPKKINFRSALFLDRDGVINIDYSYVFRPENFEFNTDIFDLCREAQNKGYLIFVVTNQAGIARGYYSENDFLSLTEWMLDKFRFENISIEKVYYCPYHPIHGKGHYKKSSFYRKPSPGMLLQAESEYKIQLEKSILIGDKLSDMKAGFAAGVGTNILFSPEENHLETNLNGKEFHIITKLSQAINFII